MRGIIVSPYTREIPFSKLKPLKEFLASSVAGGSIFKMDVTHQKATQSALVIIQTISIATLSTPCSGQVCDPLYLDLKVVNFLAEPILQIWTCSNGMHWMIMLWVVFLMEMLPRTMLTIWAFGENYRARTEEVLPHAELKLKLVFWMDLADYHLWYIVL